VRVFSQSEVLHHLTQIPISHVFGLIHDHFLNVYLKDSCPLPPPCMEWKNHKIGEAEK